MGNFYILSFLEFTESEITINATIYDAKNEKIGALFNSGLPVKDKIKIPLTAIINERDSIIREPLLDRMFFSSRTGPVLLISGIVKSFLEKLNLSLEFVEINIKGRSIEINNYYIVNIIGKYRCIDFDKSTLDYDEDLDYLSSVKSLVLDESKIPHDTDIFLLGERRTQLIIISNKMKKLIDDEGFTGFVFLKPEEYSTF